MPLLIERDFSVIAFTYSDDFPALPYRVWFESLPYRQVEADVGLPSAITLLVSVDRGL